MKREKYIKDFVQAKHEAVDAILQDAGEDLRTRESEQKAIAVAIDWAVIEWITLCDVEGELWLNKMMEKMGMAYKERMRALIMAEKIRRGEGTYEELREVNFFEDDADD